MPPMITKTITITCSTPGAVIRYESNEGLLDEIPDVTESSTLYESPLVWELPEGGSIVKSIKARGFKVGMEASELATYTTSIKTLPTPQVRMTTIPKIPSGNVLILTNLNDYSEVGLDKVSVVGKAADGSYTSDPLTLEYNANNSAAMEEILGITLADNECVLAMDTHNSETIYSATFSAEGYENYVGVYTTKEIPTPQVSVTTVTFSGKSIQVAVLDNYTDYEGLELNGKVLAYATGSEPTEDDITPSNHFIGNGESSCAFDYASHLGVTGDTEGKPISLVSIYAGYSGTSVTMIHYIACKNVPEFEIASNEVIINP